MKILKFLQDIWILIKKIAYALQPAFFSLLVLVIGFIFLDILPQGQDAVLALSDFSLFPGQLLFLAAALLWAIQLWYWARNVYILRHQSYKDSPYYPKWATRVLPRVLGLAAFLLTTYALFDMAPYGENNFLYWMAGFYLLMTILFYIFLHYRRVIFKITKLEVILEHVEEASKEKACEPGFSQLPPRSRRALIILTIIAAVPLVLFLISPQVSTVVGPAAVAILCFSIWVPLGSWILLKSFQVKLPILMMLLILAMIFSLWNDNHQVRVRDEQPDQVNLASRLESFLNKYPDTGEASAKVPPLYIVSTEGGGIRAAYWTAIVLGKIQDRYSQFSEHLFAISSVSGGSLGSGVYAALVKERQQDDLYQKEKDFFFNRSSEMLSGDFLSPTVASMFTGDLLKNLLPFPVKYFSRALALERSWEIAWKKTFKGKSNRFDESLCTLWKGDTTCQVPVLFLNGTLVETGQRIIGSPIKINPNPTTTTPNFADTLDIYQYIEEGKDMRLSTAIHNSARFTYVSPAGTLEGGIHVVDGGYFDNSGAITAMELIYAVRGKLKEMNKTAQLKVIMINNNPVPDTGGSAGVQDIQAKQEIKPLRFSAGFLAPIRTLLQVRTAHAAAAQDQLHRLVETTGGTYILLVPHAGKVTIPLGWTLSHEARKEMNEQADKSLRENWSKIIGPPGEG